MNKVTASEMSMEIKRVVAEVLEKEVDHLEDRASLYSSAVQMDSLTLLHLLVTVEERFGVFIDDEDVMNAELTDIGSLVDMIRDAIANDGAEV